MSCRRVGWVRQRDGRVPEGPRVQRDVPGREREHEPCHHRGERRIHGRKRPAQAGRVGPGVLIPVI